MGKNDWHMVCLCNAMLSFWQASKDFHFIQLTVSNGFFSVKRTNLRKMFTFHFGENDSDSDRYFPKFTQSLLDKRTLDKNIHSIFVK